MPKYYCDYCDIFLTHDSPSVRKAHNSGWKHRNAVQEYYSTLPQDKIVGIITELTRAFEGHPGMLEFAPLPAAGVAYGLGPPISSSYPYRPAIPAGMGPPGMGGPPRPFYGQPMGPRPPMPPPGFPLPPGMPLPPPPPPGWRPGMPIPMPQ